jgi:pimeloyl-ACP methyl ester carboxylesterase
VVEEHHRRSDGIFSGDVAQLEEHLLCKQGVVGSSPIISTQQTEVSAQQQRGADLRGLIQERGAESALLVGHDWGGTVAWATAMHHPEVVDRLAILNAAHPRKLSQGLHHPGQLRKSWYFFFDLSELPETVVHANDWHFFRHFLRDARPAYTPEEIYRYFEASSRPGAATGMINYYRSSVRTPPKRAEAALRPIQAPTLVIWGQGDRYLGPELAEPDHDDVPNLDRVERLSDASHWVHHDEAERAIQLLTDFFPRETNRAPLNVDAVTTRPASRSIAT